MEVVLVGFRLARRNQPGCSFGILRHGVLRGLRCSSTTIRLVGKPSATPLVENLTCPSEAGPPCH